ncbi:hypothetical protein J31TS4_18680 [Paenibacillus sp. J31TS4]|uniref:hypothetical protein n=1 Tax=Paenibacillus sp. J31TS4 TaxID=2807195 RepID=UPI001B0B30EC|nr:hypothetical protein [Paenibacillus sp. J31TS4]GIP38588.1 hypothetical protein J31TS4_18680 [Paenibacillus sp. J31TS4]
MTYGDMIQREIKEGAVYVYGKNQIRKVEGIRHTYLGVSVISRNKTKAGWGYRITTLLPTFVKNAKREIPDFEDGQDVPMEQKFEVGDMVKHTLHPEWEPTKISRISSSGKSAVVKFPRHYGYYLIKHLLKVNVSE